MFKKDKTFLTLPFLTSCNRPSKFNKTGTMIEAYGMSSLGSTAYVF